MKTAKEMADEALVTVRIARVCHDANRAYCESMDMDLLPAWDNAPKWQKDSAIMGVQAILDGKVTKPEDSHIAWYDHKVAEGWVYGPTKDEIAKTHPCMVPYYDLPEAQRAKDTLFVNIVRALMPRAVVEKMGRAETFDDIYARRNAEYAKHRSGGDVLRSGITDQASANLVAGTGTEATVALDSIGSGEPYNEPTDEFGNAVMAAEEKKDGEGQAANEGAGQVYQSAQATGDGKAPEGGDKR